MTALLTVSGTVYANDILPDPEDGMIPAETDPNAEVFINSPPDFGPIAAKGVAVVINENDSDPIYIKKVIGFKTTGESMAKFLVTVNQGNGDVTKKWIAENGKCAAGGLSAERGVATASNWSLEVCDTWSRRWALTASEVGIKSIKIEPIRDIEGDGNAAAFDVITTDDPEFSTIGSNHGRKIGKVGIIGSFSGKVITATYSRPVHLLGEAEKSDLYGVMTIDFGENPFIGTMTFRADTDDVELPKGCCCLDFDIEGFEGYDGNFPASLNEDGDYLHLLPDNESQRTHIDKYLVCYDQRYPTQVACESNLNQAKRIRYPASSLGEQVTKNVQSTHWFVKHQRPYTELLCSELQQEPGIDIPFEVPLLAKGVELKAKQNKNGGVDLTLTTTSEKGTAAFVILRGDKLENEGTAIEAVPTCRFASGGSPYTCTDTDKVKANNYQVLEIEDTGRSIIYQPVTP